MRIGVDIDGVLAEFTRAFADKLADAGCLIKFPVNDPAFPPVWDWPEHYGADTKQIAMAWDSVRADDEFWLTLPAMPGAREDLNRLSKGIDSDWNVYFITSRPGRFAHAQSARWLAARGIPLPTVLLANGHEKGRLAKGLCLDAMIDDRPENVINLPRNCAAFLKLAPYNQAWYADHTGKICGVHSVSEMLEVLTTP